MATLQDLNAQIGAATSELSQFQATQKNPLQLLNEAQATLGIPEVRTRVSSLRKSLLDTENLLAGVEGSVQGRTQGSLVTEAQRQRLTNLERQPVAEQLGKFQGAYGMETGNLSDLMGQASQSAQLGIEGQRQKETAIKTKLGGLESSYERLSKEEAARLAREQADREFAESQRKTNISAAKEEKQGKPTLQSLFEGYNPERDKWYTENVVIPTLMSEYGYDKKEAEKKAYAYRKLKFNE